MTDQRKPWEDRFRVPTMSELRADLPNAPEAPKYWDRMVEFLDGLGCQSEVRWFGPTWRWCPAWMAPGLPAHTENIVGLIVPSPTDLQIALPSDQAFVESLPVKMVRAKIRESLSLTLPPYETHWAWTSLVYHLDGKTTWTIERNQVMEDFLELIRRRLKFLTEQTA